MGVGSSRPRRPPRAPTPLPPIRRCERTHSRHRASRSRPSSSTEGGGARKKRGDALFGRRPVRQLRWPYRPRPRRLPLSILRSQQGTRRGLRDAARQGRVVSAGGRGHSVSAARPPRRNVDDFACDLFSSGDAGTPRLGRDGPCDAPCRMQRSPSPGLVVGVPCRADFGSASLPRGAEVLFGERIPGKSVPSASHSFEVITRFRPRKVAGLLRSSSGPASRFLARAGRPTGGNVRAP